VCGSVQHEHLTRAPLAPASNWQPELGLPSSTHVPVHDTPTQPTHAVHAPHKLAGMVVVIGGTSLDGWSAPSPCHPTTYTHVCRACGVYHGSSTRARTNLAPLAAHTDSMSFIRST
jgi:hypothetical protein